MAMNSCASIVELTISCQNLPNMDVFSKSDPVCIVYLRDAVSTLPVWKEIGRTEIIWDNLNPEFSTKITMTYLFEERQLLKFEVYDIDSDSNNLESHDFIGKIEGVSLGEIVASTRLKAFERNLEGPRGPGKHGSIKILAEEVSAYKEEFTIKLAATDLPTRRLKIPFLKDKISAAIFRNSFFFEIRKATENAGTSLVYRSETIEARSKRAPIEWPAFQVNAHSLCNGDADRSITISLRKHKWNGSHKLVGELNTTVRALTEAENNKRLPIVLRLSSQRGPSGASLTLSAFSKSSHSSFLDFIRIGGVQMHCFVAVDFTASNREPFNPNSLHYIFGNEPNHYQTALRSVLEIIQDYDSDKLFPALGFGALLPPNWQLSHEFFLNFHPTNPYCEGIDGVMAAYRETLGRIRLYGPTNFAPVINHVTKFAVSNRDGCNYFILLIITDGIISDLPQTINAIVAASSLPLSIIIVGVGNADFSAMNVLDADEKPLVDTLSFHPMERDIVQFVPFNEILRRAGNSAGNNNYNNLSFAKVELAREVLAELPRQFLSYMKKIGVTAEQVATKNQAKPAASADNAIPSLHAPSITAV